ncbi:MAG: LemA family protein [Pseudomonadales bacterium]
MSEYTPFFIFGGIFVVVWTISTYNKFIKFRNMIEEGWSIIDVALKRRANLIPKLISAVRGYVQHEAKVLEDITAQRVEAITGKNSNRDSVSESETEVSHKLGNLLGVAEANPDLKASTNFAELQQALNEVEAEIANSRNQFNARIRMMNTLVEQFPSNLIAMVFGFRRDGYFQLELATERDVPATPWDEK